MDVPIFYFVRHGETDWNAEGRLQGGRDIPLNDRGRRQAAQCGSTLRDLIAGRGKASADFSFISSPLSRASETMEILRCELGLPAADYAGEPRLAELSFGRWEGMTYREISASDPEVLRTRERDKWHFRPPDGESYADLMARVQAWHAGVTGDIVVTAHGGVARAVMVLFGIRTVAEAPNGDVEQGVVFEFAPGVMKK
ncbi:MAG: histidine phosphatase family protein, partial [Bradyrhizobiaceae bacterium]|nr:histidine phosphatase family protein [Bradyrhizobiaceae bacterium]